MKPNPPKETRTIAIREAPIELCQLIKFAGFAGTGGEAKMLISQGLISLNGVVETRRGKKVSAGDTITHDGKTLTVVVG